MSKSFKRIVIPMRRAMVHWGKDLFALALASCFRSLGFKVIMPDVSDVGPGDFTRNDFVLFVDWASARSKFSNALVYARRNKATTAHYNMEPIAPAPWLLDSFNSRSKRYREKISGKFDIIFDYNQNTTDILKARGENAYLLPMGYHESYEVAWLPPFDVGAHWLGLEYHPPPKGAEYDPRILDRRGEICKAIREAGAPCSSHFFRGLPGRLDLMRKMLSTPGVHLNLHRPGSPFQFGGIRVIQLLMSNRRFVLSEPCSWYPEGLTPGVHWDVAEPEQIPEHVLYWLKKPIKREAVARAGYEFIRANHRLDVFLKQALIEAGVM